MRLQLQIAIASLEDAIRRLDTSQYRERVAMVTHNSKLVCQRIVEAELCAEDGQMLSRLSQV
jgi:hypothetical protein